VDSQRGSRLVRLASGSMTSGAPAMELLVGHRPIPLPPPASPVNYRRVLRAVHATVNPLAAALQPDAQAGAVIVHEYESYPQPR
jgi:hypothetical protein